MTKAALALMWFFMLFAWAHADTIPAATTDGTPTEAQSSVAAATTAASQAAAWEALAKKNLDKANKALAKKPKSTKAKQAVAAAKDVLDSATAYKTNAEAKLREELQESAAIAAAASAKEAKNTAATSKEVTVYPTDKYNLFAEENEFAERVDAYFFLNDPLDYKSKAVIFDAKFDSMISPDEARFTVWRNFGKIHLIVSNLPAEYAIPKDKTMLLAGTITGFKNEVVSGELVVNTLLKLSGALVCSDIQCHSERLK